MHLQAGAWVACIELESGEDEKLSCGIDHFIIHLNSNMAPRLGGIKQKKLTIHPSTLM